MAFRRSLLAAHGLEEAYISTHSLSTPADGPHPSEVQYNIEPVKDLPSLNKPPKSRLAPISVRLTLDQIAALDKLKTERGIVPAELIRDAIDVVLQRIKEEGAQ